MELQNYEKKDAAIKEKFLEAKNKKTLKDRLKLSWSNWEFGMVTTQHLCKTPQCKQRKIYRAFWQSFRTGHGL